MTSLRARLKAAKRRAARYRAALVEISKCNGGEGYMPRVAKMALAQERILVEHAELFRRLAKYDTSRGSDITPQYSGSE